MIPKTKDNKLILFSIIGAAVLLLILIITMLTGKKQERVNTDNTQQTSKAIPGYIQIDDDKSKNFENLIYRDPDTNDLYIDAVYLDEATSLDVFFNKESTDENNKRNGIAIRTTNKQTNISYESALKINGRHFVRLNDVIESFGYTTEIEDTANGAQIVVNLINNDENSYDEITIEHNESEQLPKPEAQIEELAINPEPDINKPSNELPTVPDIPDENNGKESINNNEPELPEEYLKDLEKYNQEQELQKIEDSGAPKSPDGKYPDRYTEEEFNQKWEQERAASLNIFKNHPVPTGHSAYKEKDVDYIAFNPMQGAIYYDTVSIVRSPVDNEDVFVSIAFSAEWSDQSMNIVDPETKAFYSSLPGLHSEILKLYLGNNIGTELFNYIKAHADKTVTGGYIVTKDAFDNLHTEKTDGQVGDGINSDSLDFEDWLFSETDDGLRFSVFRNDGGYRVLIYKN